MSVVIPSSTEDRKRLKIMLEETMACMQKIDMERENIKEIATEIKRLFEIKPSHTKKLAKTLYKRNFQDVQEDNSDFEALYETITGSLGRTETTENNE